MLTLGSGEHKVAIDSERNQGRAPDMGWLDHDRLGFNYRLSDIACAIGLAQLERLDDMLAARARVAGRYRAALAGLATERGLELPCEDAGGDRRGWFVFVVQLPRGADRDGTIRALRELGVQSKPYLPAIHLMSFYRERFGHRARRVPGRRGRGGALGRAAVLPRAAPRPRSRASPRRSSTSSARRLRSPRRPPRRSRPRTPRRCGTGGCRAPGRAAVWRARGDGRNGCGSCRTPRAWRDGRCLFVCERRDVLLGGELAEEQLQQPEVTELRRARLRLGEPLVEPAPAALGQREWRRRRPLSSRISSSRPASASRAGSAYSCVCGNGQKWPMLSWTKRLRSYGVDGPRRATMPSTR